ncbi:MAG: hydroxymethylbilane synthase [Cytophagaceae bacterium SCN 52-12]|nr:MAG: hydroxymethylbilane synthase [Cytophagaceae bacterium SCN 52-12]
MHIRIGTRGSRLALWQADHIKSLLEKGGLTAENVVIETTGDKILDRSLSSIGGKGLFTEELEQQLRSGEIDIAVHSAKDVQSALDPDLELLGFTTREIVNDVLLSADPAKRLDNGASFTVGTSSVRRVAFLKHYFPHLRVTNMRGNLQTRLRKMEDGDCDALLLAYAGVHRMGYDALITEKIPENLFIPAVGQGSIAVECAVSLDSGKKETIKKLVNDEKTEICLLAERAFLNSMQGGCSVPVFALATLEQEQVQIRGGVISLDGSELLSECISGPADREEAIALGRSLARSVLSKGGAKILENIREVRRL